MIETTVSPPEAPGDLLEQEDSLRRPADVPEKFWDSETGSVRVDALAKSYRELERHLGSAVKMPDASATQEDIARFRRALGVPEAPDGYEVDLKGMDLEVDPAVNARLHQAGFSTAQAQLVYELARDYLGPLVQQSAIEFEAQRQTERLEQYFGGSEVWSEISRQLREWGAANLPAATFRALSSTYEGCLAMHNMMQSQEPQLIGASEPQERTGAEQLKSMMRDPRYWRDRDPVFIRQITEGFARLYGQ